MSSIKYKVYNMSCGNEFVEFEPMIRWADVRLGILRQYGRWHSGRSLCRLRPWTRTVKNMDIAYSEFSSWSRLFQRVQVGQDLNGIINEWDLMLLMVEIVEDGRY